MTMRGSTDRQMGMLLGVTAEQLVPADHPIRRIRRLVDQALVELSPTFAQMYQDGGRPSIPPEHLLKGSLLIALYSIRSERQFCERLQYDLLFKWFLDLNIADPAWDASTFSKNRQRLLDQDVARRFFAAVLAEAKRRRLLSADHFTVDGTLLEAWASLKSFVPKDTTKADDAPAPPAAGGGGGGGKDVEVDFHGEKRSNVTHASTTDADARLAKKGPGKEAKLCYLGNVLMENRTGLVVDVETLVASGTGEVDAALTMLDRLGGTHQRTLGADKGYDQQRLVDGCRTRQVTPHVAQKKDAAIDGRTTRHAGYAVSQRLRKRVEEIFGWEKTVGGLRKLRYRGLEKVAFTCTFTAAVYNLVRMAKLEVS
jgi:transposase